MTFLERISSHIDNFFREHLSYLTRSFVEAWIFPAYSVRNYFFHRYDIIRMPQLKRTRYYEVDTRMYHAVMELICFFYEKSGWENVVWYDETDENGNITYEAARYGANADKCLFPEYKGKFIMDIVKEIYNWHTMEMKQLRKDSEYVLRPEIRACRNNMARDIKHIRRQCRQDPSLSEDRLIGEYFNQYDLDWDILDRHLAGDRCNIIDRQFVEAIPNKIRKKMEDNMQKYLHLAIEIRGYLWT